MLTRQNGGKRMEGTGSRLGISKQMARNAPSACNGQNQSGPVFHVKHRAARRRSGSPSSSTPLDGRQRLVQIGDEVRGVLDAAGQAHQIRPYAGSRQLRLGHLAVGAGRGMQHAGARIGHVRGDLRLSLSHLTLPTIYSV